MEETTTIYLVRHGETAANVTGRLQGQSDVPLNENGMKQAELVAERLKGKEFDVIWSSDLSRAAVTAEKIAGGRQVDRTPLLREWDLGEWVGLTWEEIAEKFPQEAAGFKSGDPDSPVPGGESRREFDLRGRKVLEWLTEAYRGKRVLCVSHGGVLRAIFRVITGGGTSVRTDNTCICCVSFSHKSGKWQIVTWNDIAHLDNWELSTGW